MSRAGDGRRKMSHTDESRPGRSQAAAPSRRSSGLSSTHAAPRATRPRSYGQARRLGESLKGGWGDSSALGRQPALAPVSASQTPRSSGRARARSDTQPPILSCSLARWASYRGSFTQLSSESFAAVVDHNGPRPFRASGHRVSTGTGPHKQESCQHGRCVPRKPCRKRG